MGFRAARGGGASARFAMAEAMLLRGLVGQVAELIGEGLPQDGAAGGGVADGGAASGGVALPEGFEAMLGLSDSERLPDDPVLARLLPDAYPEDPVAAGEFRRYTEISVRSGKMAAARTVLATLPEDGGRVKLSVEEAQAWLRSINDVRLALGVRLEITDDRDEMLSRVAAGGPDAAGLWVYDWLTLLQETLVEALC
jgi:hypothetical protein